MVDTFTLFGANAITLVVMASAFLAAWMRQREARYWLSWIVANLLIAVSLIAFMTIGSGSLSLAAPLANVLLVAGFGTRWRAARQFSGRRAALLWPVLVPTAAATLLFCVPDAVPYADVYCATNAVAAAQSAAILWEFWRDRGDGLTSRYGLVLSYGLIGTAFALRALQGVTLGYEMDHLLPHDMLLQVHLTVAVIHAASAGAFTLSLAYERGAAELRRVAHTDGLTALPNRRAFEVAYAAAAAADPGRGCGLALLDIDHFKAVNDRYGHAAGDEALRICGRVVQQTLGAAAFVARIGGEEFAVLMSDLSSDDMRGRLERMRETIAIHPVMVDGRAARITVSVGLFHAVGGLGAFDRSMQRADACLYAAKRAGRNRLELAA